MKKTLCVLTGLCLIILSTSDTLSGVRQYNFSDDSGWQALSGKWRIINGEYEQTGSTDKRLGIAVLRDSEGVDTRGVESIEVYGKDLGSGEWSNLGIVFGFDESNPESYIAGIGFLGEAWKIFEINTRTKSLGRSVAHKDTNPNIRSWYHLKVVFRGNTVILYGAVKGGELIERLKYTIPGGIPSGKVGLAGSNSENKYDDFIVRGPGIEQMAVEPPGMLSTTWADIKAQP